jgi:hypothetical protein
MQRWKRLLYLVCGIVPVILSAKIYPMCIDESVVGTVTVVVLGTSGKPVAVPSISVYRDEDECRFYMHNAAFPVYKKAFEEGRFISVSFICYVRNEYGSYEMKSVISTLVDK